MDEVGDDFLAGAAFAGDEQGNVALGDALDGVDHLLHGRAAENRRSRAAHGLQRVAEGDVFLALPFALDGAFHVGEQLFVFKRLGKEILIGEAAPLMVSSAWRRVTFSSLCRLRSMAHFTSASSFSFSNGLERKL